ncbi:MAG TPA: hypothetical protein VKV27_10335 [Solirubrobacteraceae bacterium]|nr:hypothetical protein [Solirubrobacteraceae bacterium]
MRARLEANPWAQVGAPAIAWELEKLGPVVPLVRTIERIIARAGATKRRHPGRRASKGIPYPAPAANQPGDVAQVDLVIQPVQRAANKLRSQRGLPPLPTELSAHVFPRTYATPAWCPAVVGGDSRGNNAVLVGELLLGALAGRPAGVGAGGFGRGRVRPPRTVPVRLEDRYQFLAPLE